MDSTIVLSTPNGEPDIWRWTERSLNALWHTESDSVIGKAFMTWMSARPSDATSLAGPLPHRPAFGSRSDGIEIVGTLPNFDDLYPPPVVDALDIDEDRSFYVDTIADHPGDFVVTMPHRQPIRIRDIPSTLIRRAFVSDFTMRKGHATPCFEQIEHSVGGEKRSYMRLLLPIGDGEGKVTRVYAVCRSLLGDSININVAALKAAVAE